MSLSPNDKKEFRSELAAYCRLAEANEARWHYSQHRPFGGYAPVAPQSYHWADCSAYAGSLVWYWAMKHTGVFVSDGLGCKYSGYGNTSTALAFFKDHHAPQDKFRVGDVAIYGTASDTEHMTVCRKAGTASTAVFSSFGQEAGPLATELHYRGDLVGVYRHPALL